jgi:hypothetical protein
MADAIDQLIDAVLVDAYGPDEQLCAIQQAFEDAATFPFAATIAGADIDVTDIDYDGDDHRGLLAVCHPERKRQTVSLLDVVPAPPLTPATRHLIDTYRRWAGAEPLVSSTDLQATRDEGRHDDSPQTASNSHAQRAQGPRTRRGARTPAELTPRATHRGRTESGRPPG